MDEAVPKKMVNRNVAIALGIICIVLAASLAGTILVLNGANQQNTNLQTQKSNLQRIVDLNESWVISNETVTASAGILETHPPYYAIASGGNLIVPYSGYALFTIYNSTVNPTGIEVKYDNPAGYGFQDLGVTVHTGDTGVIPIVAITPNASVYYQIIFSNSTTYFNSATITISYFY